MTIIGLTLVISPAYGASKGKGADNGKAKGKVEDPGKANNGKSNNSGGKGNVEKARGPSNSNQSINGRAAGRGSEPDRRRKEIERARGQADVRANRPEKENHGQKVGHSALRPKKSEKRERGRSEEQRKAKGEKVKNLFAALGKARWSHNPHDDRGQGNNGKPEMLDPFGHDKDSDRKELYGNNGRPIREKEEEPALEEPPLEEAALLLDANIDFSSLDSMQWLVNWFEGTVASYDPERHYYVTEEEWYDMWYNHFFPGGDVETATGIRLNNTGDETPRYDYDIMLNNYEGDSLSVTTTMTVSQDYTAPGWQYDDNGVLQYGTIEYQAGDVVYTKTDDVSVDSTTDTITVGIVAADDLVDIGWGSEEVYVDMEVVITDTSTGETYTQTYDKSLYLYRCPYGKITNSVNGLPIVGAKITVHFEDGSIVPLDKASNPTATNPQITDATGRYGVKLQTNRKYYMTAKAKGYKQYKSEIFTEKWHVLREDIKLIPIEEKVASNQ